MLDDINRPYACVETVEGHLFEIPETETPGLTRGHPPGVRTRRTRRRVMRGAHLRCPAEPAMAKVRVAVVGLHRASMSAAREALREKGGSQICSIEQKRC